MDTRTALLQYMCPSLGAVIAFFMFISPMKPVLRVQRKKQLGELNVLPMVCMTANGLGYIVYGVVIHDYFVYGSNISSLLLGLFYTMTCYKYANEKSQDLLRNLLLGIATLFVVLGLVHMGAGLTQEGKKTLWGATTIAILLAYYVAPLSTLAKVFKTRDSSSLHRLLLIANLCNSVLWFCYAIAINDYFILSPNALGAAFSITCLIISFVIPRSSSSSSSKGGGKHAAAGGIDLLPVTLVVGDSKNDVSKANALLPAAAAAAPSPRGSREYDAVCLPDNEVERHGSLQPLVGTSK